MAKRRHTTLNLDMELLAEAQSVLGTTQTTETIHRALQEVVDQDKRGKHLKMGTGDLTPEKLGELRENRSFDTSSTLKPT